MSLFSNLYIGTSGLQSSQEALNVVAHNVTNADTTGYVRQQVTYNTREYNRYSNTVTGVGIKQSGLGVYIAEVRQVRDRFIDKTYRNELGRQGFYDTTNGAMEEIQEVFGELDGPIFEEAMSDLYYATSELAKDPASAVNQSMVVQYCQSFLESAQNAYKDLANYQDKLNNKVAATVDSINELGYTINDLNRQIRAIMSGGQENPNDLLDQRNQALDDLSKLVNTSYTEDYFGNILVKVEGHDFITMNGVNEMGYQAEDDETVGTVGFYNVFWKDSATIAIRDDHGTVLKYDPDTVRDNPVNGTSASGQVYDWTLDISAALDTDVGELKALLLARGSHRGTYMDLQDEESYSAVEDSCLVNVMAEFDGLVHNVVDAMNNVLTEAAKNVNGYDESTGTFGKVVDGTFVNYGYLLDDDGKPLQIFHRISCDNTTTAVDEDDRATWFTINNMYVNRDLQQYPTLLDMRLPDGSEDMPSTAEALRDVFTNEEYVLNPSLSNKTSLQRVYSNLMAEVANNGNVYLNLKQNQDLTVQSVDASRQGAIGVSTDEELSNMIRFQNAYNANSRFINVIDECMEHLINTLGSG